MGLEDTIRSIDAYGSAASWASAAATFLATLAALFIAVMQTRATKTMVKADQMLRAKVLAAYIHPAVVELNRSASEAFDRMENVRSRLLLLRSGAMEPEEAERARYKLETLHLGVTLPENLLETRSEFHVLGTEIGAETSSLVAVVIAHNKRASGAGYSWNTNTLNVMRPSLAYITNRSSILEDRLEKISPTAKLL